MTGMRTIPVGSPDMATHTGFLLAEDAALHKYLSGIKIPSKPGAAADTEVGVWFRYPQSERAIKYPFITIDMLDVMPAYDLWTSEYVQPADGMYHPSVSPTLPDADENKNYSIRPFLAFRIMYQITVHCRSSLHDRYLNSLFLTDVLPPRPFWMGVDADNTWRRCEVVDFAQADVAETTESGDKRIFRKMYTVTLHAEIPQERFSQAWQVLRVFVATVDRDKIEDYFNNILQVEGEDVLEPNVTFSANEREAQGEYFNYYNLPEE